MSSQALQIAQAHEQAGRIAEAETVYRQILAAQPDDFAALSKLGMLLGRTGRFPAAIEPLQRAVAAQPRSAEAHHNLAATLKEIGRLDEALASFQRAVELKPDFTNAYRHMGVIYTEQGRQDEALACRRRAVALQPDAADIYSSLLYSLHFRSEYDGPKILAEHRTWTKRYEQPLAGQRLAHDSDPDPSRKLKIGYVSADLCNHPVGRFLAPLLDHHDRSQFEIYCYADVYVNDVTTERLRQAAGRWQAVQRLSHADLARLIRQDRIDILVDLAQHTARHRLLTFALKPAPVQVAWLGYPGTTGLEAMDYRLTDPYLDPPGIGDADYSERSIRLPHCFWCYEPLPVMPEINSLPALRNGFVTFGCLNRFAKVTPEVLQTWSGILKSVEGSHLLIHSCIGDHLNAVRRIFADAGVDPSRLEFVPRQNMSDYVRQYHRIDIALDPFPHGGGTVTCDALWMGVPVVTLPGRTAVSRGGASLLNNVGLSQFVAQTPRQYGEIAAALSQNPAELQILRSNLRERMKNSPLMDAPRFAAGIEAAYRQMWRNSKPSIGERPSAGSY